MRGCQSRKSACVDWPTPDPGRNKLRPYGMVCPVLTRVGTDRATLKARERWRHGPTSCFGRCSYNCRSLFAVATGLIARVRAARNGVMIHDGAMHRDRPGIVRAGIYRVGSTLRAFRRHLQVAIGDDRIDITRIALDRAFEPVRLFQ